MSSDIIKNLKLNKEPEARKDQKDQKEKDQDKVVNPSEPVKPAVLKTVPEVSKKRVFSKENKDFLTIKELSEQLATEKESFTIGNRTLYIDNDIKDVLDLLRVKAKISSSLLVSYLFKKFFLEHPELLEELKQIKGNKFLG